MRLIDLTGQRFGRWVVVGRDGSGKYGAPYWECLCDCGSTSRVCGASLRTGISRSCGCLCAETTSIRSKKHGHSGTNRTPTYRTWRSMVRRCTNPKDNRAYAYLARGISVCDRWRSFENFLADMGERPEGKTIDRIDNEKGYFPENCRWATASEQATNKRTSRWIEHDGRRMTLSQWAAEFNIGIGILHHRLKSGWPVAHALTTPVKQRALA